MPTSAEGRLLVSGRTIREASNARNTIISRINLRTSVTQTNSAVAEPTISSNNSNNQIPRRSCRRASTLGSILSGSSRLQISPARPGEASSSRVTAVKNKKSRRFLDKEVQTDKSDDEKIVLPIKRVKRRGRSVSPCLPCAVCFNEMLRRPDKQILSLKCGHIFCGDCVEKCFEMNKLCPLCMEPLSRRFFRRIYL